MTALYQLSYASVTFLDWLCALYKILLLARTPNYESVEKNNTLFLREVTKSTIKVGDPALCLSNLLFASIKWMRGGGCINRIIRVSVSILPIDRLTSLQS